MIYSFESKINSFTFSSSKFKTSLFLFSTVISKLFKVYNFFCKSLVNAFINFEFEYFNLTKYPNVFTKENFKLLYKLVILKFSLYFITLLKKSFPNEGIILFNKL